MSSEYKVNWFNDFIGVAYRYYDLRMNVVPLFSDFKDASKFWRETVHWWIDHSIKIRFVETGNDYWFIIGSDSKRVKRIHLFSKFCQNPIIMRDLKKVMMGKRIFA